MSEITFYSNPQSRGRIVHWLLEELAELYDTQWANQINEDRIKSLEDKT